MQISAALVKELREQTGAGMMECKKALQAADGDLEQAIVHMRKAGLAKADKKSARVAAEGLIATSISEDQRHAAMVEVNSETDFVAGNDEFRDFARAVADLARDEAPEDAAALLALPMPAGNGDTVEQVRGNLVIKIGENIQVRRLVHRAAAEDEVFASYVHGGRIGVLVRCTGSERAVQRDIAMHIAASNPVALDPDHVDEALVEREKEILKAQAETSNKPPEIIEKMVQGRLKKFFSEVTLVMQPFVKDPDVTVGDYAKRHGVAIKGFDRFVVGEGIEKKEENFAEEVMAQVRDSQ